MAALRAELIEAIKAGDVHTVHEVINSPGFDEQFELKRQLLIVAIEEDQTEVVELLCNNGPWMNVVQSDDLPLVHVASKYGNVRIIETLLHNGASVNDQSPEHQLTPLIMAVRWGQHDAVRHLLEAGANANLTSGHYKKVTTPLHEAVDAGYEEILNLLLAAHADVNFINGERQLPLHLCYQPTLHGEPSPSGPRMAKRLIDCGSDVNAVDLAGNCPLHLAISRAVQDENFSLIRMLCVNGAHIGAYNDQGNTALHTVLLSAVLKTDIPDACIISITKLLLNFGAKVTCTNTKGHTPLHIVLVEGFRLPLIDLLVEAGSDINHCGEFGETLFHSCAKTWGMDESVRYLLRHGVCYDTVCHKNLSPLSSAVISCYHPTITTLCQEAPGLLRPACSLPDVSGRPLNYAVKVQALDMVEYLLKAGYCWTRDEVEYIQSWPSLPAAVRVVLDSLLQYQAVPRLCIICRDMIRLHLQERVREKVHALPLPNRLQNHLLLLDL